MVLLLVVRIADVSAVGTNGPGAIVRENASIETASSRRPPPPPPRSGAMWTPNSPCSTRAGQNGGNLLSRSGSTAARATAGSRACAANADTESART